MKADRRLWFTADRTRMVEDGDADAAFLAYRAGDDIAPADQAKAPGAKDEQEKAADPAPNKSRRPQANKGR